MKRYIALLRGINISGKNRIPMAELKKGFEDLSFQNVKTYLNSGNVIFSNGEEDNQALKSIIEQMIKERFGLQIPVYVITKEKLEDILDHAPEWWGNDDREIYDNLIFILPPASFSEVYERIGEPKEGLEKIMNYRDVIFWSFDLKHYQKTNWWPKTAGLEIGMKLTIRTANTVRKIVAM